MIRWSRGLRYPGQMLLVTTAATLATLPLALVNFRLLAPAGLLANLVCAPVIIMLVLPTGLIGLSLSGIVPLLSGWIFFVCGALLGWLSESLPVARRGAGRLFEPGRCAALSD